MKLIKERWSIVNGHWSLGIGHWALGIGHWGGSALLVFRVVQTAFIGQYYFSSASLSPLSPLSLRSSDAFGKPLRVYGGSLRSDFSPCLPYPPCPYPAFKFNSLISSLNIDQSSTVR